MWKGAEGCSPPRTQKCLFKSGVSYHVGGVKYFSSTLQHALGEERHFVSLKKCRVQPRLARNPSSTADLGFPSSLPRFVKIILQQPPQNVLCILAIRLLFAFALPGGLGGVPDPQLAVQFRPESLEPARMSTGFHAHTLLRFLGGQFTVELLGCLTVLQSALLALPSFTIDKCNLLKARMIITT